MNYANSLRASVKFYCRDTSYDSNLKFANPLFYNTVIKIEMVPDDSYLPNYQNLNVNATTGTHFNKNVYRPKHRNNGY